MFAITPKSQDNGLADYLPAVVLSSEASVGVRLEDLKLLRAAGESEEGGRDYVDGVGRIGFPESRIVDRAVMGDVGIDQSEPIVHGVVKQFVGEKA